MTSALDSDNEGSTRHIAVASQRSICPCTLTPLLLLLYLPTCTDITLQSLHSAITPRPSSLRTPASSPTFRQISELVNAAPASCTTTPYARLLISRPPAEPCPAPLPAITPAALACTRLRVPSPLLCNPHHNLIAQCNDCTLQSLQAAITPHPYTHPTPSLSFTLHHALPALLP